MRPIARILLIAFMVALLPVRGWVGDAMAVEMLASSVIATKLVAQEQDSTLTSSDFDTEMAAGAHADCPGHAQAASGGGEAADTSPADASCQSCSACQVCHTVALAVTGAGAAPSIQAQALPAIAASLFRSADAARGFKPPIS